MLSSKFDFCCPKVVPDFVSATTFVVVFLMKLSLAYSVLNHQCKFEILYSCLHVQFFCESPVGQHLLLSCIPSIDNLPFPQIQLDFFHSFLLSMTGCLDSITDKVYHVLVWRGTVAVIQSVSPTDGCSLSAEQLYLNDLPSSFTSLYLSEEKELIQRYKI